MRNISVVFDDRERFDVRNLVKQVRDDFGIIVDAMPTLDDGSDPELIERLKLGDIVFMDKDTRDVLDIVERKTVEDYKKSLMPAHMESKRLLSQIDNMTNCEVPYLTLLLIGDFSVEKEEIRKGVVTLSSKLRHGTPKVDVVTLTSMEELPLFVARNAQFLRHHGETPTDKPGVEFHELMLAVRKSQTDTPEHFYHHVLQVMRGVSHITVQAIVTAYPKLSLLQNACRLEGTGAITKLKSNNNKRSLGKALAERLVANFLD